MIIVMLFNGPGSSGGWLAHAFAGLCLYRRWQHFVKSSPSTRLLMVNRPFDSIHSVRVGCFGSGRPHAAFTSVVLPGTIDAVLVSSTGRTYKASCSPTLPQKSLTTMFNLLRDGEPLPPPLTVKTPGTDTVTTYPNSVEALDGEGPPKADEKVVDVVFFDDGACACWHVPIAVSAPACAWVCVCRSH